MAIKNIEFIQIEAVLDSLGRKQIGVEPDVDSELNFRMWGGKDSTGALTHWLAKNKPGLLHSLRLSSLAGQSQSIAKIDANGNIIRGSIDDEDFPEHNEISGLQGGEPGQYYHVTLVEKNNLHAPLTLGSALGPLALTGQEIRFLFGTGLKLQDGELVVDTSSLSHSDLLNTDADDHAQYARVDGTRGFVNPVSGVFPEHGSHLATKEYVDAKANSGIDFLESVKSLAEEVPESPSSGDRYIVGVQTGDWSSIPLHSVVEYDTEEGWLVSWDPLNEKALGARVYVEDQDQDFRFIGMEWVPISETKFHSELLELTSDDHPQYPLANGTRGFSAPVAGVTPTDATHLATKEYVDAHATSSQIKDNARDDVTDPIHPDNITDIEQLTFVRNVGADANYTEVTSEERTYGILLPAPSLQADHGKVPMLNSLGQIVWETVPSPESVSDEIADAVATVKTNNIFTIQLGSIQKAIGPEGTGTLYSYWTIISPSMDFPLSEKTTLSFLIKQMGTCTKAYLAIYEIDIYNQKKKWVANTNDFHASLAIGYNYVNLAYINSSAKLSSDKFYYVCLISNINSFQFAGNSYDTQFNGVPRLANKIDNVNAEFNAATMQTVYAEFGLTEGSEILDRLFFNISNVERIVDPVAPTPFVALTNITLGHTKNVGNLVPAATTFGADGILYQKVIPQMDITIKSVWVLDYHSSQNAALLSLFILDEDLNSITSVNVPTLTNAGTSEKIGNYYVHKYAFSTPITLQEGKGYWMPAIGNCSNGTSEWAIQYTAADPSIPIRDMLAVSDITNFAIADKVIANNKNGCYLKLIDTTDTEWQI